MSGPTVALRYRGQRYSLKVCRLGPDQYRVEVDGARIEAVTIRWASLNSGSPSSGGVSTSSPSFKV